MIKAEDKNLGPQRSRHGILGVSVSNERSSEGASKAGKVALLVVLSLQNVLYTMFRRYSVGILGEAWSSSSVLLVGEVMKLVLAGVMTLTDSSPLCMDGAGGVKLWQLLRSSLPMAVPAFIFWVMNLLSYVSLERIDASTFTVCAQMKILMTAFFSGILLKRRFHPRKWRALVLLLLGAVLVSHGSYPNQDVGDRKDVNTQYILGVAAVLTEVGLSGFVSVYFEKMLKSKVVKLSVWDRNVQLAVYSIPCYLMLSLKDDENIFKGWTTNATILAALGGAGGLLVAFATKYTDAVLKTFATCGAIIMSTVAGHLYLEAPLDLPIGIGACCTILSLINYSDEGGLLEMEPGENKKNAQESPNVSPVVYSALNHDGEPTSFFVGRVGETRGR